ncbi:MAG: FAD-dependent oxidoreductase [Alphaproteobacteria bacterium]|nr:FAD-dependent oxidoreductase [Alphaproteobacteria bacterium]
MQTNFQLSRRGLLAGLAVLAARPVWALPSNPDVVVIGAGAAGIGAALELTKRGLSCVVVEADSRIGGRAYTDTTTFGIPFDIGCAWIHAADRNPFYKYAQDDGYKLHFHDLNLTSLYYGQRRSDARGLKREHEAEETIRKNSERIAKRRDTAVTAAVPQWTPPFEAAATYLGPMDMGVDLSDLSTTDYARSADLDPNYLVYEGYGTLVAKVGESVPVKLSTPVRTIRWGEGKGVRVETDAGTIEARAAIVTVSTGVLAAGSIRFDPVLPEWKETAIGEVPMGLLAKIPMLIPGDRFGIKPFENVLIETPGRQEIYFLAWPWESDLMVGFVGGEFGWQLSAAGEDAAIDFAKQRLAQTFGSDAPKRVTKALFTKWASNPLTRGAYAACLPGHYVEREKLGRPLAERVFFAGEALAGPLIQTAGGAFLSGEETATKVAAQLAGPRAKAA